MGWIRRDGPRFLAAGQCYIRPFVTFGVDQKAKLHDNARLRAATKVELTPPGATTNRNGL